MSRILVVVNVVFEEHLKEIKFRLAQFSGDR